MKQFMEIAGRRLAYLDEGEGPAILFGHDHLLDSTMWAPQIEALKGEYRCLVPELWGHGDSDAWQGTCSLETLVRVQLALLDALEIEQCVLVGHGIGGLWGIELARLAPERLRGVVLIGSFAGLEPQIPCERYLGMLAAIEQAAQIPAVVVEQWAPLFFRQQADADLLRALKVRLLNWPADKIASLVMLGRTWVSREDRIEVLEAIRLPTLVLGGCEDRIRPMLETYLMSEVLDCPLKEIPGAGHLAPLENPAAVNRALAGFMAGV